MKLFACMCNQPLRLPAALAPVRAALVAPPPVSRWGFGYIQGGDVLLVRTPKASAVAVDLAHPLDEIKTDCVIAQAVRDVPHSPAPAGTDNTPPFRFRRWLFAQSSVEPRIEGIAPRLAEHVPEYLRRNIKGRTRAELTFHLFLAMLHDEGNIDDPNLSTDATRRALALTLRMVQVELQKASGVVAEQPVPLGNVALSNGRSMVVARHGDGEPLRFRRLWMNTDRNEPERGPEAFRGIVLVSGGELTEGFEDVPANHAVMVSRDLKVTLAELAV